MSSTGLLVVSNVKKIGKSLRVVEKHLNAVYIHLNIPPTKVDPPPSWGRLISQLYADQISTDMRILVGHPLKERTASQANLQLKPVDMIFSDHRESAEVCELLRKQLNIRQETICLDHAEVNGSDIADFQSVSNEDKVYDTVVLGGTFDRIHVGHKIFLTQAVLRACRRLVVGVTTDALTKSKTLAELILPVEQRIRDVKDFLKEIDNTLQYEVVPIDDPFGPTQSDPNMQLIVVSAETLRGGHKVNEIRVKNNLRPLEIFCIDVVGSNVTDGPKETKVSSSNTRIDLLGTRIRKPEPKPHLPTEPYIIGLTGGIATGKSEMAQRFRALGAQVLDCDKIAHEIYEPGQKCYHKIISHFGRDIVDDTQRIDRTKLGPIVFSDAKQLEALNNIVWPELLVEVKERIRKLHEEHHAKVVLIEAAILLKAGWETECHEVWSMIVPPAEAVKRVMERNGLSEEDARRRLATQLSNPEIVAKSNVVFSSQWDASFTQQQAEKAWQMLISEFEDSSASKSML